MSREVKSYIDHTLLKPTSTFEDISTLVEEAITYQFAAVCVPPVYVKFAKEKLADSTVALCTVIGFPLSYNTFDSKLIEIKNAMDFGADELDVVVPIWMIQNGDFDSVTTHMKDITAIIQGAGKTVKWILETAYLSKEEIKKLCEIAVECKADFVKTSTGFASSGATIEDIQLMKETVGNQVKIKASGGIRDRETALKMIDAGADRIGCSSSLKIIGVD